MPEPPWLRAGRLPIPHAEMGLYVLYREPAHATPVLNSRSQISMSTCSRAGIVASIRTYLGTFCLQDRAIDHREKNDDNGKIGCDGVQMEVMMKVLVLTIRFSMFTSCAEASMSSCRTFDVFFSFLTLFSVTMSFGIFDAWTWCFECFF